MSICRACGTILPDTASFCAVCGQTLSSTTSAEEKVNLPQASGRADSLQKGNTFPSLPTDQPLDQLNTAALTSQPSAYETQGAALPAETNLTKPVPHPSIETAWSSTAHIGGGAPTEPMTHNPFGIPPALARQQPLVLPQQDPIQSPPFLAPPPFPRPLVPYTRKRRKRAARSGCVTWLIIPVLVLLLLISSLIAIGQTILVPSITIENNTQITSDGQIQLHGSDFIPGNTITLTLDNTQPLYYSSSKASADTVTASSDGSFDVAIPVGTDWQPGLHSIQALEGLSLRRAMVSFTLDQAKETPTVTPTATPNAELSAVAPAVVTLGPVSEDSDQPVSAQVTLTTTGTAQISWSASWGQNQASWLQLDQRSGQIQAPGSQIITVSAQSGSLDPGNYIAIVRFSSPQRPQDITLQVIFTITMLDSP